jgi:hypothetical protein
MPYRNYTFTLASGATTTNLQLVGVHVKAFIVVSGMTSWASGNNNETIQMRGGLSETDTHGAVLSNVITTFNVKGVYPMPSPGLPFMSLGLSTAATSSGSINVIVYSDDS